VFENMRESSLVNRLKRGVIKATGLALLLSSLSFAGCWDYSPKVSGQLQDNETDTGKSGIVRVYNAYDNKFLKEALTDENGNFNLSLDNNYLNIILQARMIKDNQPASYIRTMEIPTIDASNLVVRAIPYDELKEMGITPEQFRDFVEEMSFSDKGLEKFDTKKLKEFRIILNNEKINFLYKGNTRTNNLMYASPAETKFSEKEKDFIKEIVSDNITDILRRKISIEEETLKTNEVLMSIQTIYIIPDNNSLDKYMGFALSFDLDKDGYIDSGVIRINTFYNTVENTFFKRMMLHEIEHILLCAEHPSNMPPTLSVMYTGDYNKFEINQILNEYGKADIKLSYITEEETFKLYEMPENLFSTKWLDELKN
jgi:hypothetical protein